MAIPSSAQIERRIESGAEEWHNAVLQDRIKEREQHSGHERCEDGFDAHFALPRLTCAELAHHLF